MEGGREGGRVEGGREGGEGEEGCSLYDPCSLVTSDPEVVVRTCCGQDLL